MTQKNHHLRTIPQLYQAVSKPYVDNREKKLVKHQYVLHMSHNMANFGPLTAGWRVWGTPANFNGFRILAALLHGAVVVGVSQCLRR